MGVCFPGSVSILSSGAWLTRREHELKSTHSEVQGGQLAPRGRQRGPLRQLRVPNRLCCGCHWLRR